MTDQVNPVGGLASGMTQTLQAAASLPSKPPEKPAKPAEPKASSQDSRSEGVSKESLEAAAKIIQEHLQQLPTDIKFLVDKTTGMFYFKIIDPDTKEVVLQVPSDEILNMSRKLRELRGTGDASGVLISTEG